MATDNLARLKELLEELFQFRRFDLDFGIYRILKRKRERGDWPIFVALETVSEGTISDIRPKTWQSVESTWRLLRHAPERAPAGATRPPPATRRYVGLLQLGRLQASPHILRRDQLGGAGLALLQVG